MLVWKKCLAILDTTQIKFEAVRFPGLHPTSTLPLEEVHFPDCGEPVRPNQNRTSLFPETNRTTFTEDPKTKAPYTAERRQAYRDAFTGLFSNLGFAHLKLKQFADCDYCCSQAILLDAENAKARFRRATARYEMDLYKEAMTDLKTVVRESGGEAVALTKGSSVAGLWDKLEAKLGVSSLFESACFSIAV